MTTLTIILITWILAGLLANALIIYDTKQNVIIGDIPMILIIILLGYIILAIITVILLVDHGMLPTIKLPNGDKVIWKYPKKN